MAHRSDSAYRLSRTLLRPPSPEALPSPGSSGTTVWVLLLPEGRSAKDTARPSEGEWIDALDRFCGALPNEAVLCLLTTPPDAAALLPKLEHSLHFQLWVVIKKIARSERIEKIGKRKGGSAVRPALHALRSCHAALLILTRRSGPLRHSPIRIAYTYCPACDRTTKDYGGKKHLYHEYGTLMSDVWRDVALRSGAFPEPVVDRLQDLFAVEPYRKLVVMDLRAVDTLAGSKAAGVAAPLPKQKPAEVEFVSSRLAHGDCLRILSRLPADSVDFCFADPPYNIRKTYTHWNDSLELRKYFSWCDRWLSELARLLKPGGTLSVLNIPRWAARHFEHLNHLLDFQAWIAWEGLSLPVRKIMPAHYSIVCFSKGTPRPLPGLVEQALTGEEMDTLRTIRDGYCLRPGCVSARRVQGIQDTEPISDLWWNLHRLKHNSRRDDHPCQLPPSLMRRLIALFTRSGEVVMDPFNGIGTTTLAAAQLGRRYIGIELSKEYHEVAKRRHALLDRGGDPFAKRTTAAAPRAKNSRVQRLTKQKYAVTKKTLQLDVKRIARELGRIPTRDDVREHSPHPMEYFERYFIDWGEVTAATRTTGMTERRAEDRRIELYPET